MIDEFRARELAEKFLEKQDGQGHAYKFVTVKSSERHLESYGVIFDVYTPKNDLLDGPIVMLVDKQTGEVCLL